jgi:hypothetical protein
LVVEKVVVVPSAVLMVKTLEDASYCEIVPEKFALFGLGFEFEVELVLLLDELVDVVALPLPPQATRRPVAMSRRNVTPIKDLGNVRITNFFILLTYILIYAYKSRITEKAGFSCTMSGLSQGEQIW